MAYRADIEIAVKGAQELKRLQDQVSATSKLVDGLNNYLQNIGSGGVVRSIDNLKNTVADAANAFNQAALGTREATLAAQNYITATTNLNQGLQEKLVLLKQINEARRQEKLTTQGIRETTGLIELGPGPASPIGSLVGQVSPVEEKLKRTIQAREDEKNLQQALLRLEEQSVVAANKELQIRGDIARLTAQGVNAAKFRVGQPNIPLALPAFQERGLQPLDNSVKLSESRLRIEQALGGQYERGVRFLEKQVAEQQRLVDLGIIAERTNRLPGSRVASTAGPAGGFPVSGPLTSPGFQKTQKGIGKFGENLALGAGFPLLFGGGPGSVAGSVLGSFVGSGFGGQILGGALGSIIDQTVTKVATLGTAIQQLDFKNLESSGIRLTAELQTQVQLLRQVGDATQARQLVEAEILNTTGAVPGTVDDISNAVNLLTSAWTDFTTSIGVTVGIIGAPLAAALAAVLNIVNLILKGFNTLISLLGAGIKAVGEWVVTLVAGKEALKQINDILLSNNQEIQNARAEYQPILSDLNDQVLLNRELLNLEKQKRTGTSVVDKTANAVLDERKNITKINYEYDSKIREENAKITSFNKAQVEEVVRLLNVKRNQAIEEANIAAATAKTLIAQGEAKRLAKEAAQAAEAHAKAISSITKEYYSDQLKIIASNIQLVGIQEGSAAARQRELDLLPTIASIQSTILTIERAAALKEAEKTGTVTEVNKLYDQRLRLLQQQLNIQQALKEQEKAQAELDTFTKTKEAIQSAIKPFQDLHQQQKLQNQTAQTYNRLISEGVLPSEAERIANFDKLVKQQLTNNEAQIIDLETTIEKAKALGLVTVELENQLSILKQQQAAIKGQAAIGPGAAPKEQTSREKIAESAGKIKEQLNTLIDPANQVIEAATAIGDAFSTAFKGVIDGTMTAQQALASFFQSVANYFLDMAAKIIAKWIEMTVLNSVLALFPGGSSPGIGNTFSNFSFSGAASAGTGGIPSLGSTFGFATGGFVTGPTNAVVGEGGQPEYIIPANKMAAAMSRYSAGTRGSAVIPAGGGNSTTGTDISAPLPPASIDLRYTVERINSVDYVTNDQFQQGMAQAAKQGAAQGEQRTLRRLQMSNSTRKKVGI